MADPQAPVTHSDDPRRSSDEFAQEAECRALTLRETEHIAEQPDLAEVTRQVFDKLRREAGCSLPEDVAPDAAPTAPARPGPGQDTGPRR